MQLPDIGSTHHHQRYQYGYGYLSSLDNIVESEGFYYDQLRSGGLVAPIERRSSTSSSQLFGSDNTAMDHETLLFDVSMLRSSSCDEKTILALKNHKEAEKRRRERINSHLRRLRSMLSCSAKIDKATLLAKVVQRVRELNRDTSQIITHLQQQQQPYEDNDNILTIPSQNDGYSVIESNDSNSSSLLILKASLCCEDRSDLYSDLSRMVNGLNLKTLRAEMLSLGGRVTNVMILSGERSKEEEYMALLHDKLNGIIQRSGMSEYRLKKRRRVVEGV